MPDIEAVRAEVGGVVLDVTVDVGDVVEGGDVVAILDSMKMEIPVITEATGIVSTVAVIVGETIPMAGTVVTIGRPDGSDEIRSLG